MRVTKTAIDGVLLLNPKLFGDERGKFYESWKDQDYTQSGIREKFFQDNVSISHKNVLRGLHFQKDQGQLVTLIYGKIFDVVVDIRPQSPTFKQHVTFELSDQDPSQIYMPPGCAHGFYVHSDLAVMHYKCSQYYTSSHEGGILWNDPQLGIEWPLTSEPIINNRDMSFAPLKA